MSQSASHDMTTEHVTASVDQRASHDANGKHQGKVGLRKSRLGLRGIFGRSKAAKENDISSLPGSASSRTAVVTAYRANPNAALASTAAHQQLPVPSDAPEPDQVARHGHSTTRRWPATPKTTKSSREGVAKWSALPLSEAFVQSSRHITLPAATMSPDSILRWSEKQGASSQQEEVWRAAGDQNDFQGDGIKSSRNAVVSAEGLEWTAKIYILVHSGYVLQYADDGHFDRCPEKVLRLGPSSAAFATDAIPGRHWVVHVSSVAGTNGASGSEPRSFLSKLPFRTERRTASNLLMVFESANAMEAWISALREEIQKQGGKKNLSETGMPKVEGGSRLVREQPSQRTLVVRDPSRFGRTGPEETTLNTPSTAGAARAASSDAPRDPSLDDGSTTDSVVSQDERRLDSLRECSQRLSYISSGQRTVVTSTGSSPDSSPTRGSFASQEEEEESTARAVDLADMVARPRPNASDIAIRRQSSQVTVPFVDANVDFPIGNRRPSAGCVASPHGDGITLGLLPTPNFSVPHSSSRRFSYAKLPMAGDCSPPREAERGPTPRLMGGQPPTVMATARPLSMVSDQPSWRESVPERPTTSHRTSRQPSPRKMDGHPSLLSESRSKETLHSDALSRTSSVVSNATHDGYVCTAMTAHRLSAIGALRRSKGAVPKKHLTITPHGRYCNGWDAPPTPPLPTPKDDERSRYRHSLVPPSRSRRGSVEDGRRASMRPTAVERPGHICDMYQPVVAASAPVAQPNKPLPPLPSPTTDGSLQSDWESKENLNRRSLSQLNEGPPPAPPPTRALPPIPQRW
ncbi:hypothetical protein DCS_00542 [Drechmeria coniospora]|uniref:Peptidase family M20/M25/M40 protein n=1 Tax=Drechmeria coniospora TaxID=98403 RepID=A0A151GQY8_DRECN|nr:hypothetical protein DCS_00542 [Drechmeria coniospora]KYK59412.1 hypothetical protein DCS_00542 [Drechmeria coniospora]